MKYATLVVEKVIMHEILRGTGKGGSPQLSDVPTELSDLDRGFIQGRVRMALAKDARPICEEAGLSPVSALARSYLRGDSPDAVTVSREFARELQAAQHGISPAGIFVFADAALNKKPALLIAKLEHHEGVRATPTTLPGGGITFGVQLLTDLLFTKGSKVFKVAMFVAEDIDDGVLNGVLVDHQINGAGVAQFFLTEFLGCRLTEKPDMLTERFYNAAQSYISSIPDAEKAGRYEMSLLSELQSNKDTVSVLDFAAEHLDLEDRDSFTYSLQGSDVPTRTFGKDNGLVKTKIARIKLNTEAGVTVLAPPETVDNGVVSITANNDQTATITVRDRLKAFK